MIVALGGLGYETVEERRERDGDAPAEDGGPHHPDRETRRPREQSELRPGVRRVRQDAGADVTSAGEEHRTGSDHQRECEDGQQRRRTGRRQGLELLDPAEGAQPDQPVQADAGIGDHPDGVGHPQEDGGEGGGLAAGSRQLARERADGEEHAACRHHGQGEEEGGPGRDGHARAPAREHRDDRGDRPQHDEAGAQADQSLSCRAPPGGLPRRQQVPPPVVLLAAQQLRAEE